MKKFSMMIVAMISLSVSSSCWAGLSGFNTDAFNEVINENMKNEKQIREELRENAGFVKDDFGVMKKGQKEVVDMRSSRDVINVPTDTLLKDTTSKKKNENNIKLEQDKQKRIAEEINQLN